MPRIAIIGAGHNGLITAFYLARAGLDVTIFERSAFSGGAVCNVQMNCGCVASRGANHFGMLHPRIWREMNLFARGVRVRTTDPSFTYVTPDQVFDWHADLSLTIKSIQKLNQVDASRLPDYFRDLELASNALRLALDHAPPSEQDFATALDKLSPGLGQRFVIGSLRDAVSHYFSDATVQAMASATAFLYPCSTHDAGTAFPLIYLSLAQVDGVAGSGVVLGGMGTLSSALTEAANEAGAILFLNSAVSQIRWHNDVATKVILTDGREFEADYVVINADPISGHTLLYPRPPDEAAFDLRLHFASNASKANIVLSAIPASLKLLVDSGVQRSLFIVNGDLGNIDSLAQTTTETVKACRPYIEFSLSSAIDRSLTCCEGHHVASAFVLDASELTGCIGRDDSLHRVVSALDDAFPGIRRHILQIDWIAPSDIENIWHMFGGNVDHGNLLPGNRLAARDDRARWISRKLKNVVFCGSSRFPGGLVSGRPALASLKDLEGLLECNLLPLTN